MNKTIPHFIVIEGVDGVGKATQTAAVAEQLQARGYKVRKLSFPAYDKPHSALVKQYLAGDFGSDPSAVNPYAASIFYTADRYGSYVSDWQKNYADPECIIIADRYTTSNEIHQGGKLSEPERSRYLEWLDDLEYERIGLPRPNAVIYLYAPYDTVEALRNERNDVKHEGKDIHENSKEYMQAIHDRGIGIARQKNWSVIDCTDTNGKLLPVNEITLKIMDALASITTK